MTDLPTTQRFVAVLNKKIEPGKLMNALGHMATGLCMFGPLEKLASLTKKFSLWH